MLDDVVDDGEAPGTGGSSWNSSNRRRRPPGTGGVDLQIGAAPAMIRWVEWWLRSSERWGVRWYGWFGPGNLLFIESHEGCGAVMRATWARRLRRAIELGEGAGVFVASPRSSGWRQLGRGGPGGVAFLPCPSRPRRTRVGFSCDGGCGSWSRACPTA